MALIWMTVSHPMRACENRFLLVCFCFNTPLSLTDWLTVCELALSSVFSLAGCDTCQWLWLRAHSVLDTRPYSCFIFVVFIIMSHTDTVCPHSPEHIIPDVTREYLYSPTRSNCPLQDWPSWRDFLLRQQTSAAPLVFRIADWLSWKQCSSM